EAVAPQLGPQPRVLVLVRPDDPAAPAGIHATPRRVDRLHAEEEVAGARPHTVGRDHEVDLAFGDPRTGEADAQGRCAVHTLDRGDRGAEADRAAPAGSGEAVEERAATDAAVVAVAVEDAGDRVGAQDPAPMREHPVSLECLRAGAIVAADAELVE